MNLQTFSILHNLILNSNRTEQDIDSKITKVDTKVRTAEGGRIGDR